MRKLLLLLLALIAAPAAAEDWAKRSAERDVTLPGFRFGTGETMDLRMHVTTLGTPRRNAAGEIDNAVMVLHGTGGSGKQFFRPQFADELYGPGQPFDITKYYVILPDNIGHGQSSKPSDGQRMAFPRYAYGDMVLAQQRLLTEGLGGHPAQGDPRHLDGLHARFRLGHDLSRLCRAARAVCLQHHADRRAQPDVAADVDRRDQGRSRCGAVATTPSRPKAACAPRAICR